MILWIRKDAAQRGQSGYANSIGPHFWPDWPGHLVVDAPERLGLAWLTCEYDPPISCRRRHGPANSPALATLLALV